MSDDMGRYDPHTDTISRAKAIDALRKMQTYKLFSGDDMLLIDQAGAQTELMLLPPAQPDVPDINVGDTISRQAAIEAVAEAMRGLPVVCIDIAEEAIKQLPPAQPERITSRWIPCGERPPENDNDVLVQMNDGSMMVDYRAASSNSWFWAELDDEPVAWMPLPEPYKGVTE